MIAGADLLLKKAQNGDIFIFNPGHPPPIPVGTFPIVDTNSTLQNIQIAYVLTHGGSRSNFIDRATLAGAEPRALVQGVDDSPCAGLAVTRCSSRYSQTSAKTRCCGSIPCWTILRLLTSFIMVSRS
jgi:hypothetical protein